MSKNTDDFKEEIKDILKSRLHFNEEQAEEMFYTLMQERALELDKESHGKKCHAKGFEDGIQKERSFALEGIKSLLCLGYNFEDLKRIFHLNDEEVKFVTSM